MWLLIGTNSTACRRSKEPDKAKEPAIACPLMSIWGSSPSDIWAVGSEGCVVHFDGKTWRQQPSITARNLTAVAGTASNDVWAVGAEGVTLHFDGHNWSETESSEGRVLLGAWSNASGEVWVSGVEGSVGLLRYYTTKKHAWENKHIPGSKSLWRAAGAGADNVWVVGSDDDAKGFVLRSDGKHLERVPFSGPSLRGVYSSSANDVWIATYDGALQHWDGTQWGMATTIPDAHWLGLWGSGPGDVWAFGLGGTVYHYTGTTWARVDTGTREIVWSAWGHAPNDVWFVGNAGTRLHWTGQAFER
jgi:hypothetical protein